MDQLETSSYCDRMGKFKQECLALLGVKNTTRTRHWTGCASRGGSGQGGKGFADIGLPCWLHMPPPSVLLPLSCSPQGSPPHPYLAPEFSLSSATYKLPCFSASPLTPTETRTNLFLLCPVCFGVSRWVPYKQNWRREYLDKWFPLFLWALRANDDSYSTMVWMGE